MLCLNFSLTFALGCEIFSGWIFPSQLSFTWEILEHIEYSALRQNMKIYISKQMWPNWHPNPMARINTHWGERALSVTFPGGKTFWLSLFRPSLGKHTLLFSLSPCTFHYPLACFLIPLFFFLLSFYFRLLPYLSISLPIIPSSLFLLPSLFLWIIHQCFSELLSACLPTVISTGTLSGTIPTSTGN